jgi:hypothetical protein
MKRHVCLSSLVVALLSLGIASGQQPSGNGVLPAPTPERIGRPQMNGPANAPSYDSGMPATNGEANGSQGSATTGSPGMSSWIANPRCNCCGPVGGDGPIGMETYFRSGVSIPFGSGILNNHTSPGFMMAGGVRSLFFNPAVDAAWTVDLGASTAWYGPAGFPTVNIRNPTSQQHELVPVTPKSVNESFFNLALGRECYLWGNGACSCDCPGPNWRVGWDVGGRYGTGRVSLQPNSTNIRPRTASIGGFLVSLHSDLEFPTGCCIFFIGLRTEYGWTFSDLLGVQNHADLQSVNLLVNLGLRF